MKIDHMVLLFLNYVLELWKISTEKVNQKTNENTILEVQKAKGCGTGNHCKKIAVIKLFIDKVMFCEMC